jgi:hypothetical protein
MTSEHNWRAERDLALCRAVEEVVYSMYDPHPEGPGGGLSVDRLRSIIAKVDASLGQDSPSPAGATGASAAPKPDVAAPTSLSAQAEELGGIIGQVVWQAKRAEQQRAVDIIKALRGFCWCEHGVGNPMVHGHSRACLAAGAYIAEFHELAKK